MPGLIVTAFGEGKANHIPARLHLPGTILRQDRGIPSHADSWHGQGYADINF